MGYFHRPFHTSVAFQLGQLDADGPLEAHEADDGEDREPKRDRNCRQGFHGDKLYAGIE